MVVYQNGIDEAIYEAEQVWKRPVDVALKVSKTRALIIQSLCSKPLKLCLPVRVNRYSIWKRLEESYAVVNVATEVQLQTRLNRMSYKNQSMYDYVF